jgi:hypothetical protein
MSITSNGNLCILVPTYILLNARWQFGDTLSLNRNNRVSSLYWTRGSKLCFLIYFSYLSCYFLSLVFLQNHYLLMHRNPISCPIFLYLWYSKVVRRTCAPYFWHRTRWFLEARRLQEPGSRLTTSDLSPFCLLPKVSGANGQLGKHESYLSYSQKSSSSTFLRDISPARVSYAVQLG